MGWCTEMRRNDSSNFPFDAVRRRLRRLGLLFLGGAAATLVGFHLVLFVERLRDQSILEPRVALQWLGALALLAFLGYLKNRGVSLVSGRSALAFWLLVLLLHVVPHAPAPVPTTGSGDLLLALPNLWMAVAIGLFLGILRPRGDALAVRRPGSRLPRLDRRPFEAGFASSLSARPPPFPLP